MFTKLWTCQQCCAFFPKPRLSDSSLPDLVQEHPGFPGCPYLSFMSTPAHPDTHADPWTILTLLFLCLTFVSFQMSNSFFLPLMLWSFMQSLLCCGDFAHQFSEASMSVRLLKTFICRCSKVQLLRLSVTTQSCHWMWGPWKSECTIAPN